MSGGRTAGKWGRSRRDRGGVSGVGVTCALGRCSRDATHAQECKESRAGAGDGGVPRGFAGQPSCKPELPGVSMAGGPDNPKVLYTEVSSKMNELSTSVSRIIN